ncbi:unnamed protein product [Clavelina lepadiformis]|uniref:Large ribosomal subunit protein bL28m n=1 Tax=Clavelina lepadiformis TaxID=159417 RepID=A0ABP0FWG1_CLALP
MPRFSIKQIPIPVYKPTRTSWVHKRPRNDYLMNPAVKYPIYKRLPSFWREQYEEKMPLIHQHEEQGTPRPQHGGLWKVGEKGEPERVENIPLKVYYPPESKKGIWGGEGWVIGAKYTRPNHKLNRRYDKIWKPIVMHRTIYSEILDRDVSMTVTPLTLDMIDEAYGFDAFVLKTPVVQLQEFGSKLKREMLLTLARKDTDLYPNNHEKRDKIYTKYQKYVISEEEASWVGLTLREAMHKQWDIEKAAGKHGPVPLLDLYTKELKEKIRLESGEPATLAETAGVSVFQMQDEKSKASNS